MTNIPDGPMLVKPLPVSRSRTFILMFKPKNEEKDYWQKLWLIQRYAEELGFKKGN